MAVNLPPETGNKDLDQWTFDVTEVLQDGVPTDRGGGENIPVIIPGDEGSIQFNARYLDVAFGTDGNGLNFNRSFGVIARLDEEVWIGFRNQEENSRTSNTPAGFVWYELVVPTERTGINAYYRNIGGRRVSFEFSDAPSNNFTQYTGFFIIDLDELPLGTQGPAGLDGLFVFLTTDTGTIFKNNAGAKKRVTANLNIGGTVPTDEQYDLLYYTWTYGNEVVCIDTNRNVIDFQGNPLVATGQPDALMCTFGNPATTTQNTVSGVLRDVLVGPEEVSTTLKLGCSITNIPD